MKKVILSSLLCILLTSCGLMPQILGEVEHIVDDTAVNIKVSQEAFQRQTNLKAIVELDNGQLQGK